MRTFRRCCHSFLVLALVLAPMMLAPAQAVAATTWWVDIATGDNANPGTQAEPFRTIEAAIAVAVASDEIRVRPGTYGPEAEQDFPIYLPPGVRLYSTDGPDVTTIVGDASAVIVIANPSPQTNISGFTIRNSSTGRGITISCTSGTTYNNTPVISGCVIEECGSASSDGGGIMANGYSGGNASPYILYTTFRSNVARYGGAMYFGNYTDPLIQGCTIEGNSADAGGGVFSIATSGETRFTGTEILGNSAASTGGGVYVSASGIALTFDDCSIRENTAIEGGGSWVYGCNPEYLDVEITGNAAAAGGGGAYHSYSNPAFNNCLLAQNTAADGGAAICNYSQMWFYHSTIADNGGPGWAGIYADTPNFGETALVNSVVWGHGGKDVRGATSIRFTDTQDTDLAGDGNAGIVNVIHADPGFNDPGALDYRLTIDSPCIDVADPNFTPDDDAFGTERPTDGDGDGTAVRDMGYHEFVRPEVARTSGGDRYETAIRIAQRRRLEYAHVIVASGENFPDALSAAGLAGAHNAALVLVRKGIIPEVAALEMEDWNVTDVTIVGGIAAVSQEVEEQLAQDYSVERIAGPDRYATAALVAQEIMGRLMIPTHRAFIARGDAFPDALAVSPISFRDSMMDGGMPILLTRPGELPQATEDALEALDIEDAVVVGGEAAVSSAVKGEIDDLLVANGGVPAERWSGANRYETAVRVAEGGVARGRATWRSIGIATGVNFPDALAGGVGMGFDSGVVLLTRPDALSPEAGAAIQEHMVDVYAVELFGGPSALSDTVKANIESILGL